MSKHYKTIGAPATRWELSNDTKSMVGANMI